jgi:predicted enzyme related to lactoylglutathione lyase
MIIPGSRFRVHIWDSIGGKVIYPPIKTSWGDVLAAIFDPDGNVIGLSQS